MSPLEVFASPIANIGSNFASVFGPLEGPCRSDLFGPFRGLFRRNFDALKPRRPSSSEAFISGERRRPFSPNSRAFRSFFEGPQPSKALASTIGLLVRLRTKFWPDNVANTFVNISQTPLTASKFWSFAVLWKEGVVGLLKGFGFLPDGTKGLGQSSLSDHRLSPTEDSD